MAVKKLFRVVVRQRVNWTPGVDSSVPETRKPLEVEGASIERDITDYVEGYSFRANRGTIATDLSVEIINPQGALTPTNPSSSYNRMTLNGIDTYAPLLVEGNEIQVYRIPAEADPNNRSNWIPRFRGRIHAIESAVAGGQDSLKVTAGSVLTELTKKTMVGSFSPIMRTTSQVPANSFYTLSTLGSAVSTFRGVSLPQNIPTAYTASSSNYGDPSTVETGEIPALLLSKLLWWDADDVFYRNGRYLALPYFIGVNRINTFTVYGVTVSSTTVTFDDETYEDTSAKTAVPVQDSTATAIWNLNGQSWYVATGSVTKDATEILDDQTGSLKLSNAGLRFDVTGLPTGTPSVFAFGYKMTDASRMRVQVLKLPYNRLTYTYGTATTLFDTGSIFGPTSFSAAQLGGVLLNAPTDTAYQWNRAALDIPALDSSVFADDTETNITLIQVKITTTGLAWIDNPRWEFLSIGVGPNGTATQMDNNILNLPRAERWTTSDGIIYRSPYPQHRVMSRKNNRAIIRNWGLPYGAGTLKGYSPNNLKNRALPESSRYQRELLDGSEFEVLYEKGALQLQGTYRRCEVFVSGTYYDLAGSPHMEAAEMMKRLMLEAGIPTSNINLEPTGIIMSRITLGVDTTTSLLKALKDILSQLPQNYHLYETGDGCVVGRFIQQNGSPRIFNPMIQVPIPQQAGGVLVPEAEYWYAVTALMPDGKETLTSNLVSTVPYSDYYDFQHKSIVISGSCPVQKIKPVPNMAGLVIRRARAYKTAADLVVKPAPKPAYVFPFTGSDPDLNITEDISKSGRTGTPVKFSDAGNTYTQYAVKEVSLGTASKTTVNKG